MDDNYKSEKFSQLPDDWFFQVMGKLADIGAIQRDIEHMSRKIDQLVHTHSSETESLRSELKSELAELRTRVNILERRGHMTDGYKKKSSQLIKNASIILGVLGSVIAALIWFFEKVNG